MNNILIEIFELILGFYLNISINVKYEFKKNRIKDDII